MAARIVPSCPSSVSTVFSADLVGAESRPSWAFRAVRTAGISWSSVCLASSMDVLGVVPPLFSQK